MNFKVQQIADFVKTTTTIPMKMQTFLNPRKKNESTESHALQDAIADRLSLSHQLL